MLHMLIKMGKSFIIRSEVNTWREKYLGLSHSFPSIRNTNFCFDLRCRYIERLWNIEWCLRIQIQGLLLITHALFLPLLSDHTVQAIQSDDSTLGPYGPREIGPILIPLLTSYLITGTLLNLSKLHLLICQVEITILPIGFVRIKWIWCMKVLSTGCTDCSQYSIESYHHYHPLLLFLERNSLGKFPIRLKCMCCLETIYLNLEPGERHKIYR